jgi:hypothetical protein
MKNAFRELYLATEAANFFLACCWNNTINKVGPICGMTISALRF